MKEENGLFTGRGVANWSLLQSVSLLQHRKEGGRDERSCVRVKVPVLAPVLSKPTVSVDVKQHCIIVSCLQEL